MTISPGIATHVVALVVVSKPYYLGRCPLLEVRGVTSTTCNGLIQGRRGSVFKAPLLSIAYHLAVLSQRVTLLAVTASPPI
jgi:hypothetical protein